MMSVRKRYTTLLILSVIFVLSLFLPLQAAGVKPTAAAEDAAADAPYATVAARAAARTAVRGAEMSAQQPEAKVISAAEMRSLFVRLSQCVSALVNNDMITTGENSATEKTLTGFEPLPEVTYSVTDPENSRSLSCEALDYSYGIASGGQPNRISVEAQRFFEQSGYDADALDTSGKKILYLTFDCGYENGNTPKILKVLEEKNVPAAFFCTLNQVETQGELTAEIIRQGHIIGNHSATHCDFSAVSRTRMAQELEQFDNYMRKNFGYTSKYFRFPQGRYSLNALELVNSLGFKSCFWSLSYADWDVNNQSGAAFAFEKVTSRLHPGAIILLHSVSSDNAGAMADIIDYARAEGYEFAPLTALA